MANIHFKLFGQPVIIENEKEVYLPAGKVSALLYYLLIKKVVSRDEVADIFWPRSNDKRARISLRNAIHKIKQAFDSDIISTPNKAVLSIEGNNSIYIDVDVFEKDPDNNLDLYTGDFLQGFYIKDSPDFEYWVLEQKNYYKDNYINTIKKTIENDFNNNNFENLKKNIINLISLESYDEFGYLYLFKMYCLKGRYDKIINEYHNFRKLLKDELGLEPSCEIEEIYEHALEKVDRHKSENEKKDELYDRTYEIEKIQMILDNFKEDKGNKSILLYGESGVGKTILKKNILKNNKNYFQIYEIQCYMLEKDFSYSPLLKLIKLLDLELDKRKIEKPQFWKYILNNLFFDSNKAKQPLSNILENAEEFNLELIYITIQKVLELLGKHKKILVVFEDLQFMDRSSLKLLVNLILQSNEDTLFFNVLSNEVDQNSFKTIFTLNDLNKIELIKLENFTKVDVGIIIKKAIGDKGISERDIDNIYNMSRGNALLLNEYIELYKKNKNYNFISPKMNLLLREKFSNVNDIEKDILTIVSAFYGSVNINSILNIIDYNAFEIVNGINNLIRISILEEKKEKDGVNINYINNLYKNYVYNNLSDSSRQILHKQIAKSIDAKDLKNHNDVTTYIKLKYHYEQAMDRLNSLKYEVYLLNYYLNFNHEVFPNLDDYEVSRQVKMFINNNESLTRIKSIEEKILVLKSELSSEHELKKINEIELIFLYCKGRYLIRAGKYKDGVQVMKRVIEISENLGDLKTKLQGNKQMIIYGIQINDANVMLRHIIDAIKDANRMGNNLEKGVLFRLYGVYHTMVGNIKQAEEFFNKSIETISKSGRVEHSSSISIAANYNYIGEIRNSEQKYIEAMEYFEKAIKLSNDAGASCLSIFYINAGKTSFFMGNTEKMENYLKKSEEIIKKFDSYWKAPVLYAFLALSSFLNERYVNCLSYLKDAMSEVQTINNPKDIGEIYFVKTLIRHLIDKKDNKNREKINSYLKRDTEYYYYMALDYLDKYKNKAELKYLKENIIKRELK